MIAVAGASGGDRWREQERQTGGSHHQRPDDLGSRWGAQCFGGQAVNLGRTERTE